MTPEQIRDRAESDLASEKYCGGCQNVLPRSSFYKNSKRLDGLATQCKSCNKVYEKKYREKHREKRLLEHKEWRKNNPGAYSACQKKWRDANREITSYFNQKYRAQKKKAMPKWLDEKQISEIRDFYWLSKDLTAVSGQEYHVDHIIPLNGEGVCGLHVPWNLQVLPADINLKKSNSHDTR